MTRYFSPWNGIGEDPVNGSSHTVWPGIWDSLPGNGEAPRTYHSKIVSLRGGEMIVRRKIENGNADVEICGAGATVLAGRINTSGG